MGRYSRNARTLLEKTQPIDENLFVYLNITKHTFTRFYNRNGKNFSNKKIGFPDCLLSKVTWVDFSLHALFVTGNAPK